MEKVKQKFKTPIRYYGGKQTMLKHLLLIIPDHIIYTESFAGGAAMLFAKEQTTVEVINDLNTELVNFYWAASLYYDQLKKEIDKTVHSRAYHSHASYIYHNPLFFDPIKRAWAVWMLCKASFASQLEGTFGFDKSRGSIAKKITNAKDAFTEALCKRLSHVTIECDNALKIIKRYDAKSAFHFVDPPYINSDCAHYSGMFNTQNFIELLDLLAKTTLQKAFKSI